MSRQERMLQQLQESQQNMLSELKNQRSRQKKLINRIRGDNDTISRMRGNRTLMLNDGNISLPVYDYLHYEKVFDDFERQRRMETLEILNRFGESIVIRKLFKIILLIFKSKKAIMQLISMDKDTWKNNPTRRMIWFKEGTST